MNAQQIEKLLSDWHEAGREEFEKRYPNLSYDSEHYAKDAKHKSKYIYFDEGTSGAFMVERATGDVFTIKGYGQVNRRGRVGNVATLTGADLHRYRWAGTIQRKR